MANIYAGLPAAELTEFARLILAEEDLPENQDNSLAAWFPATLNETIRYSFNTGTSRTYTAAAPYRGWDTPSPIGDRPGRGRVEGELPPISIKYTLRELDLHAQAALERGNALPDVIRDDVYGDIERGIRAIVNRQMLTMRDFLVDGSVTISDRNLQVSIDPERNANREATAGIGWIASPATATPFANERAAMTVLKPHGLNPGNLVALCNDTTWLAWLATTEVKETWDSNRVLPSISDDNGIQLRRERKLPPVQVIDRQIADTDGTVADLIPDGKWIYVPRGQRIGSTQYGVPVAANSGQLDIARDDRPGPVAYVVEEVGDPIGMQTHIQAVGVPVMEDPDSSYVLTTN